MACPIRAVHRLVRIARHAIHHRNADSQHSVAAMLVRAPRLVTGKIDGPAFPHCPISVPMPKAKLIRTELASSASNSVAGDAMDVSARSS